MDKTAARIINELVDNYEVSDSLDIPDLCKRVWEAAAVHVRPLIEAEARSAAMEDDAKLCEHFGGFKDGYSCASEIRALASAPPGHVCVPVEPTPQMSAARTK